MDLFRFRRTVGWLIAACLSLEATYLVVANVVISSGVIERAASVNPDTAHLAWDSAFSPWPGRVYVSGLRLRVQDSVLQFVLSVDRAEVDISLTSLLTKEFCASRVRAQGVSYRFLTKVESTAGRAERLEAFAPIPGFARPALLADPPPRPMTTAEIADLWTVRLDDVDAEVHELWFLEYRYRGAARVTGGFALSPLRRLEIGALLVLLEGGELSVGEHLLSAQLTARAAITMPVVDIAAAPGLAILHTLNASIAVATLLEDLAAANIYNDALRVRGNGALTADVHIRDGWLLPGSAVQVSVLDADVHLDDRLFVGRGRANLGVRADGEPGAYAEVSGTLELPLPKERRVTVTLPHAAADATFVDNDISRPFGVRRLDAVVDGAFVEDARPLVEMIGETIPILAPLVLGSGPLLASASAEGTAESAIIRVSQLTLGQAALGGVLSSGPSGVSGAVSGNFGAIAVGIRVRDGAVAVVPFVAATWLAIELRELGLLVF